MPEYDWPAWLLLVHLLFLTFCLWELLSSREIDPVNRLTWVIVLLLLPGIGVILYFCIPYRGYDRVQPVKLTRDQEADNLKGTPWENNPDHVRK
jgi:hypothetical protein